MPYVCVPIAVGGFEGAVHPGSQVMYWMGLDYGGQVITSNSSQSWWIRGDISP